MDALSGCPLCNSEIAVFFHRDHLRDYLRCSNCELIFTPPGFHLSSEEEKRHYDQHENNSSDPGYRSFLGRLFNPMVKKLEPHARGLDFGSGPGPTLSVMFEEQGHPMEIYDHFYAPDSQVLARSYEFITATEVVEHLSRPGQVLEQLWALVKPGGWLGLMTKLVLDREAFGRWHYKNDPTHIVFFSRGTFHFLGDKWGVAPEFIGTDVILFRKQVAMGPAPSPEG